MATRNDDSGIGCIGIVAIVLLVLFVVGYFDPPRPATIPEVHAAVGGGLAAAVAGGWHK